MLSLVGILLLISSSQSQILHLEEGDACKTAPGGPWICSELKKCSHVDVRVSRPAICTFKGRDPIVCCPPAASKMSKAEFSCVKYSIDCKTDLFRGTNKAGASLENSKHETVDVAKDSIIIEASEFSSTVTSHATSVEISSTAMPTTNFKAQMSSHDRNIHTVNTMSTERISTSLVAAGDSIEILSISNSSSSAKTSSTPKTHVTIVETAQTVTSSITPTSAPAIVAVKVKSKMFVPVTIEPSVALDTAAQELSQLPNPTGRQMVVGGHYTMPDDHKYMVLIGFGPENAKDWRCGGSLISDMWVLTAAHCSDGGFGAGKARWARLGDLDYSSTADDARVQDRRIVQRIDHPGYKPPVVYNDIALHKLDKPVVFDQYVAPICLHTTFDIPQPKATVVGWGRTEFAGELSSRLMEADITLINDQQCNKLWGNEDQTTPRGIDRKTMICAGEKEGGKDACSGDSGGPMVVNRQGSCLKVQVGITSLGRDCGLPDTPGIYTRVSAYIPWIESIVWP